MSLISATVQLSLIKKQDPSPLGAETIAGVLKGSLSETLGNAGVGAALAYKITKIYSWSIDVFKVKKGDRFGVTF